MSDKKKKILVINCLVLVGLIGIITAFSLSFKELKVVKYIVDFDSDGGTEIAKQEVEKGKLVIKPDDPTKDGFTFFEWTLDGKSYDFNSPVNNNFTLKAEWNVAIPEFVTITFDSDGGTPVESITINGGTIAIKPVDPEKADFRFVKWVDAETGEDFDFGKEVIKDTNLKAIWVSNQATMYTVTYNANGGKVNGESTYVTQVPEGMSASSFEATRTGYAFEGWTLNGETYDFTSTITGNVELIAQWTELEKFTVTFNSDGGTNVKSQEVYDGEKVKQPSNVTRAGYRLDYWELDGSRYNFNSPVTKNITLKAVWKEIVMRTVSFNVDGKVISTVQVEDGTVVKEPDDPPGDAKRVFDRWSETPNGGEYAFNSKVTKDLTLYAVFTEIKYYNVTFDLQGGSGNAPLQSVKHGSSANKPANPTKNGFRFSHWSETATGGAYGFGAVTKDTKLFAVWIQQFTVSFDVNGGAGSCGDVVVDAGGVAKTSCKPTRQYHTFVGWSTDPNGTSGNIDNTKIDANTKFYAIWAPSSAVINASKANANDRTYSLVITINGVNVSASVSKISYSYNGKAASTDKVGSLASAVVENGTNWQIEINGVTYNASMVK